MQQEAIAGVDLGNKLAGTTVICYLNKQGAPEWRQSVKNKDADAFLHKEIPSLNLQALFMDAPLSLPGVYRFGAPYQDYFYRKGDRLVKAMSPMFLAGLTARAIRLKDQLEVGLQLSVMEAYPKAMADKLNLKALDYKGHKASIGQVTQTICEAAELQPPKDRLSDWHHVDALLALLTGIRWRSGTYEVLGDPEEGAIIV
jgi:predicted nuclease with RNAse H fold